MDEPIRLDYTSKDYEMSIATELDLVCEALVREIAKAKRWSAVLDAFNALGHVRGMAKGLIREAGERGLGDDDGA